MQQYLQTIIPFITALGFGGVIGAIIKHLLDRNAEIKLKRKIINEEKYRTILIYMSIVISPSNKDHFIINDDILEQLTDQSKLKEYALSKLSEYYYQSVLYASDSVMHSFKAFLKEPTREKYILAALMMRTDLWGSKTNLKTGEIRLE